MKKVLLLGLAAVLVIPATADAATFRSSSPSVSRAAAPPPPPPVRVAPPAPRPVQAAPAPPPRVVVVRPQTAQRPTSGAGRRVQTVRPGRRPIGRPGRITRRPTVVHPGVINGQQNVHRVAHKKKGIPTWAIVLIVLAVIGILVAIVVLMKRNK